MMTPLELDTFRAQMLVSNMALRMIICSAPHDYDFEGRPSCQDRSIHCSKGNRCQRCSLESSQQRFMEWRIRYQVSKSPEEIKRLARELPRIQQVLSRAATGWRRADGKVQRFSINFEMCPHGMEYRPGYSCDLCEAEEKETDAL